MASPNWAALLTRAFPNLAGAGFAVVAQPSEQYNCIAYAAGDTGRWWEPGGTNRNRRRRHWHNCGMPAIMLNCRPNPEGTALWTATKLPP